MKKVLIITGVPESGKSVLTKWIIALHGKENSVMVSGRARDVTREICHAFSEAANVPTLVIIDSANDVQKITEAVYNSTCGIQVNPRFKETFVVPPSQYKVIIETDLNISDFKNHGKGFHRTAQIIEIGNCGYNIWTNL